MEKELEKIRQITNGRESTCSCSSCQHMCRVAPCLGTPSDILKIAESGHTDKLSITGWAVGVPYDIPVVPMVQAKMTPNGCSFFENNLCTLHDKGLKPTEGRLTKGCEVDVTTVNQLPVAFAVARTWGLEENNEIIKQILFAIKKHL